MIVNSLGSSSQLCAGHLAQLPSQITSLKSELPVSDGTHQMINLNFIAVTSYMKKSSHVGKIKVTNQRAF